MHSSDSVTPARQPAPEIRVEPWPGGGFAVRMDGHPAPVSRHDTEEEALERAAAYQRGLADEHARIVRDHD
jgi:hypothetical protein